MDCTTQQRIEVRLQELRQEIESGQKVMAALEEKKTELTHTLLRIRGAVQILEELLTEAAPDQTAPPT